MIIYSLKKLSLPGHGLISLPLLPFLGLPGPRGSRKSGVCGILLNCGSSLTIWIWKKKKKIIIILIQIIIFKIYFYSEFAFKNSPCIGIGLPWVARVL